MSGSSPDDLAIAFRSLSRRLKEAQGDAAPEVTASAHAEVRSLLDEAGRLLGAAADPAAVADAIAATKADQWDAALLDRLRAIAIDLGRLVRHIGTLAGTD
jgi:hypothetical protein